MEVSSAVMRRRIACEKWKANNRERYLQQKRELSARPAYRAHVREKYHRRQALLREAGILPRKLGRPRMYDGQEALDVKREQGRQAAARYHLKKISQVEEKHESTTCTTTSENPD